MDIHAPNALITLTTKREIVRKVYQQALTQFDAPVAKVMALRKVEKKIADISLRQELTDAELYVLIAELVVNDSRRLGLTLTMIDRLLTKRYSIRQISAAYQVLSYLPEGLQASLELIIRAGEVVPGFTLPEAALVRSAEGFAFREDTCAFEETYNLLRVVKQVYGRRALKGQILYHLVKVCSTFKGRPCTIDDLRHESGIIYSEITQFNEEYGASLED